MYLICPNIINCHYHDYHLSNCHHSYHDSHHFEILSSGLTSFWLVIECALLGCYHFGENLTLTFGQCHRQLGNWKWLNGLYLGTKYEVCRRNTKIASEKWSVLSILTHFWTTLTLTFDQGHRHLSHWMRLIRLYLGTKYEVCKWNSLWDITSSLVFYPFLGNFDLDLWPWPSVKVIDTWVIECALLGCT